MRLRCPKHWRPIEMSNDDHPRFAFLCGAAVAELVPRMQDGADLLDREAEFPAEEIERLRQAGALSPPLPVQGSGTADELAALLILVGQGNLSVGRILEAHVNARHLIARYGAPREDGRLYGLWVTDPPAGGLRMRRIGSRVVLSGGKQFCSAAGHATGALVTAQDEDGATRMLVLPLGIGEVVKPLPSPLQGMRAAVTGAVDFSGCEVPWDTVLGGPEEYLREPDFSAGAWRGSAVALGGLIALLDFAVAQLKDSGRLDSPHTQARLGQAFIARESSRLWVSAIARIAEDHTADTYYRVTTVGLGRTAVETACLDAMRLIQRSLGLTSFRQGTHVERICRDLSTYLRQPAPDEVLTEAATWFAEHPAARIARCP
jgi:alkylation response protein AidB-like acyl-CoA dehydrogenase